MKNKNNFKIRQEDELLLCCARTRVNSEIEEKIISLTQEDLDWQYLLQMAAIHKLTPLLYHNLNFICPKGVPNDVLLELKNYYHANVQKNLVLTGELIKISKLLKSNDIDIIPYKGPVLANLAYGNISFREFGDIDILINKSDAIKAKDTMVSGGYELYRPIMVDDSFYMKLEPEYQFFNRNTGTVTEIKWKIEGNFFSLPKNLNILSEHLEKFDMNGFEIHIFSPVNQLLILCIHAAKHDWERLSWICDISELLKLQKDIDWFEILEKAERLNIKRILYVNILLAYDLFELEIPNDILISIKSDASALNISKDVKERIFKNKSLNIFQKFIFDLKKRESLIYGFKDGINGLTRPTYIDFTDISLPESLFYLYFVIRPFLLLKRYGKDSI